MYAYTNNIMNIHINEVDKHVVMNGQTVNVVIQLTNS